MLQQKPFIHLFNTNGMNYIFDVNTNSIIAIDRELDYDLKAILNNINSEISESSASKIKKFLCQGLLKPVRTNYNLEHPATNTLKHQLNGNIRMITLQVTQNCNLRCKYCAYSGSYIQRKHNNKRMSLETAYKAIDFYKNHSSAQDRATIGFYGGEPFLEFELIKKSVEYAKKIFNGKNIMFQVTTNATLLNDEIIDFIVSNDFSLVVSLDGPPEIHNASRVFADNNTGSFNKVIENVEKIRSKYPKFADNILFNAVLNTNNDFDCSNNFFATYDTVKNCNYMVSPVNSVGRKETLQYSDEYFQNYNYSLFLKFLGLTNRIDKKYATTAFDGYINNVKVVINERHKAPDVFCATCHPSGPCVIGVQRPFVSVDGKIFPCERVSETSEIMCIGHIDDGFYINKAENLLNVGKVTETECKNCWAFNLCSQCVIGSDNGSELSKTKRLSLCNQTKNSIENMLKDYCVLRQNGYNFDEEVTYEY